jgi:hypothetical protein
MMRHLGIAIAMNSILDSTRDDGDLRAVDELRRLHRRPDAAPLPADDRPSRWAAAARRMGGVTAIVGRRAIGRGATG